MNKLPTLLIHGIFDTPHIFDPMIQSLTSHTIETHAITLVPNNGSESLKALAENVKKYIEDHFEKDSRFNIVAFSMGGLIARYYLQRMKGIKRVHTFITVATPHYGTRLAYFYPGIGAREMRPGSEFLKDLNSDAIMLQDLDFYTIVTPFDLMIVPGKNAALFEDKNFTITSFTHPGLIKNKKCITLVARLLTQS